MEPILESKLTSRMLLLLFKIVSFGKMEMILRRENIKSFEKKTKKMAYEAARID